MTTETRKMFQPARYVLLLCLISRCEMQFRIPEISNVKDHDIFFEENEKCFWHIFCDLKLSLRVKEVGDPFTMQDIKSLSQRIDDPRIVEILAMHENFRNASFWEHVLQPRMCRSETEKLEFTRTFAPACAEYGSDVCYNPLKAMECDRSMKVLKNLYEMLLEFEAKGECVLTELKKYMN